MKSENVAIVGATDLPDRFAFKAQTQLASHGHKVFPVTPKVKEISGVKTFEKLSEIKEPIDTVTLYVNPTIGKTLLPEIIALKPKRVIFNPGTEDSDLEDELEKSGIKTQEACTLVLLGSGRFS